MDLEELLARDEHFFWMSAEGLTFLNACFGLELEQLQSGDTRGNAGRIGYLLQGEASLQTDNGASVASSGGLLGICSGGDRGHQPCRGALTALTPCDVLWIPYEVMEFACHRNCWFHTRLILEIRKLLEH